MVRIYRQRIFRSSNRRGFRGCAYCVRGKVCQISRFTQSVATYLRVLECKYFKSKKYQEVVVGVGTSVQENPVFSLPVLAYKAKKYSAEDRFDETKWFYRDNRKKGRFYKISSILSCRPGCRSCCTGNTNTKGKEFPSFITNTIRSFYQNTRF